MKKLTSGLVVLVLILSLGFSTLANDVTSNISVVFNKIKVIVNGKTIDGDNILYKGTTYIPIRKISENMGCKVEYDSNTHMANISSNNVKVEGCFICRCIGTWQENNISVYRFEIATAQGTKYGFAYGGDFEIGKNYVSLFNEPTWIIDGNGFEQELNLELYCKDEDK